MIPLNGYERWTLLLVTPAVTAVTAAALYWPAAVSPWAVLPAVLPVVPMLCARLFRAWWHGDHDTMWSASAIILAFALVPFTLTGHRWARR